MSTNPVLLVHGMATSAARTWGDNGWIDLLTDTGRTVIAPDLLGHGAAPAPHDPDAYLDLEDRLLRDLIEAVGDHPVDAVGFSLGSRTLLCLAAAEPDRFSKLVLSGAGANLFRRGDEEQGAALADAIGADTPPADPTLAYFHGTARSSGNDPLAMAAYLRRPSKQLWTDEALAAITCPVLVVLGDRDFAGPAEPLIERLTGAEVRLVTLRDTDHFATPKNFTFLDAALSFIETDT